MGKEIYFCVDNNSFERLSNKSNNNNNNKSLYTYYATENAIKNNTEQIVTLSLAHFSFDLIDMGYDIYLCRGDIDVKIEPGMNLHLDNSPCKELRIEHNIFRMFIAGIFDEILKG